MAYTLDDLLYLMSRLRDKEKGCPWDIEQDFSSIAPSTLEECYELVDAITVGEPQQIREELGDLLFQVVFYAQLGKEQQWFTFADVVDTIASKLVRRHPHVFPDGTLRSVPGTGIDVEKVKRQWEAIKEEERGKKQQHGVLDDIPKALPALCRAQKIQKRLSRVGFDWPDAATTFRKLKEELAELEEAIASGNAAGQAEEMGDLLFSCVNVARHLGIDTETALADANRKCSARFNRVEELLRENGRSPEESSLEEMDILWEQAKRELRSRG
jgi:ATP diphosphatase